MAEEEPAPLALDDVDAAGTLTRYLALSSVMCMLGLVRAAVFSVSVLSQHAG